MNISADRVGLQMKRRSFLKTAGAIAAALGLPFPAPAPREAATAVFTTPGVTQPLLLVERTGRTISLTRPATMLEVHRALSDLFVEVDWIAEPMPTMRVTDTIFSFENGWTFDGDQSRENVREASWTEGDEQWSVLI